MTWYRFSLNGSHMIAPLTPAQAAALGAEPAAAPPDLGQRIGKLVRELADSKKERSG